MTNTNHSKLFYLDVPKPLYWSLFLKGREDQVKTDYPLLSVMEVFTLETHKYHPKFAHKNFRKSNLIIFELYKRWTTSHTLKTQCCLVHGFLFILFAGLSLLISTRFEKITFSFFGLFRWDFIPERHITWRKFRRFV